MLFRLIPRVLLVGGRPSYLLPSGAQRVNTAFLLSVGIAHLSLTDAGRPSPIALADDSHPRLRVVKDMLHAALSASAVITASVARAQVALVRRVLWYPLRIPSGSFPSNSER